MNGLFSLQDATLAARAVDPYIGTFVKQGMFTIVRAVPSKGRSHDVTELSAPMLGWQAVEWLRKFADGAN